tara:strand:- start:1072 stop:1344 length:273 start_codon:yes stop_codon:yes gene_type:complete
MIKIETFRNPKGSTLNQLIKKEPTCFNGFVDVEKYEITTVKIEESKEVYRERLQNLWEECDNHHHWAPLKGKAKELGVELVGHAGSKRKR